MQQSGFPMGVAGGKYRQDRDFMALLVEFRRHPLFFGRFREELGCHSLCVVSRSPPRVVCELQGMSSVEPFGWRSLLLPGHSLFFARHSPGLGGREVEGMELEEETARLVVPFGWPEGAGMELDERGMRHGGLVGRS